MHGYGLVLLYPSFWNESSFSTNYYEAGVHSVAEGHVINVPDYLREDLDLRFTVPLLHREDSERVWKMLPLTPEGLVNLHIPVVDLQHRVLHIPGGAEAAISTLKNKGRDFLTKVDLY
jgi:hypothetical protein